MFGEIRNRHGEKIDYRFHPGAGGSKHVVLIGHGLTANLDRPFLAALAEGLAAAGIPALRFSFAGNGGSEGTFEEATLSKEVDDLGAVLDAVERAGFSTSYAGHSMGGAVGVLRASSDSRIRNLVSLAGMVRPKKFVETEFGTVTPDAGVMWDEPQFPLSRTFVNDLSGIDSVLPFVSRVSAPVLFVYGSDDDLIPIGDGLEVFSTANEPKDFIPLEGANHVFAGDVMPLMVKAVTLWLLPRL